MRKLLFIILLGFMTIAIAEELKQAPQSQQDIEKKDYQLLVAFNAENKKSDTSIKEKLEKYFFEKIYCPCASQIFELFPCEGTNNK